MTVQGIKDSFNHLRNSNEMKNLQDAARCRSEADWLIGINGTRAITSKMFSIASKKAAAEGRVQTPTLAMIVTRDYEIENFKPQKYWRITGNFEIASGKYTGVLQKPQKLNVKNSHDRVGRFWSKDETDTILESLRDEKFGLISEKKKNPNNLPQGFMTSRHCNEKPTFVMGCLPI